MSFSCLVFLVVFIYESHGSGGSDIYSYIYVSHIWTAPQFSIVWTQNEPARKIINTAGAARSCSSTTAHVISDKERVYNKQTRRPRHTRKREQSAQIVEHAATWQALNEHAPRSRRRQGTLARAKKRVPFIPAAAYLGTTTYIYTPALCRSVNCFPV